MRQCLLPPISFGPMFSFYIINLFLVFRVQKENMERDLTWLNYKAKLCRTFADIKIFLGYLVTFKFVCF